MTPPDASRPRKSFRRFDPSLPDDELERQVDEWLVEILGPLDADESEVQG